MKFSIISFFKILQFCLLCLFALQSSVTISTQADVAVWNFDYTGSEQTFTVPWTGNYKLETWGAQGGNFKQNYIGGFGGFSVGKIHFDKNTLIYIYTGGKGTSNSCNNNSSNGGFNGGGKSFCITQYSSSGGGATHIATKSGLLSTLENSKDSILIVSGGGGGLGTSTTMQQDDIYGSGGGFTGVDGADYELAVQKKGYSSGYAGFGGNQTASGKTNLNGPDDTVDFASNNYSGFGKGGENTLGLYSSGGSNGGGGGFYGGGSSTRGHAGGGGGSGYIGNSQLTDKHMTCYNCETSDDESTKTISNTCSNETPTTDCSKIGNGYAKITYLGS